MTFQQLIDSLFAALIAANPQMAPVLLMLQGLMDSIGIPAIMAILASLGITTFTTPQQLVDALFAALEKNFTGHKFILALLTMIQATIDAAVSKLVVVPAGFKSLK